MSTARKGLACKGCFVKHARPRPRLRVRYCSSSQRALQVYRLT